MKQKRRNRIGHQNIEQIEYQQWHFKGVWWLAGGVLGVILCSGFGALMLYEFPAFYASLGAIGALLAFALNSVNLRNVAVQLSHFFDSNPFARIFVSVLMAFSISLWLFPGQARLHMLVCGDLGCKPDNVSVRFAFGEWQTIQDSAATNSEIVIENIRNVLFQKLGCVNGFQSIEPLTNSILAELDLLITATLQQQPELTLSAQIINPRTRQGLQTVTARTFSIGQQTQDELAILMLQNELFAKIMRAINLQLQPDLIEMIDHIPTNSPEALKLNNRAVAAIIQGNLDEANSLLQEALVLDSRYADAHNNLGTVFRQKGDLTLAIEQYELATELLPCISLYHYNLGFVYEENRQANAAIAAYKAALARNPAYVKALNNLGFVYLQIRDLERAIQYLQRGLQFDPSAAYLHKNLGRVYLEQGRTVDAIATLQQALTLSPNYAEAYYFLAQSYTQGNQLQDACAMLAEYAPLTTADAQDDPERPKAARMLANMLNCPIEGMTP